MTEAFLQFAWQHGLLDGPLTTTKGLPVVVERYGELNRDAGPDFFNARIRIGDVQWAGNVEVHVRASDWKAHHHSDDKSYNNVILHVVYIYDADILLENGKEVPTLVVATALPAGVWERYEKLIQGGDDQSVPCASRLPEIPEFLFRASMERQVVERLQQKVDGVHKMLQDAKGNWEQVCYWLVARYFGSRINSFPFELLAKVTPLSVLAKIKDNPFRVEALYMGQAGLLEEEFTDDFPKALQREYGYMRDAYKLTPLKAHLWKFFRLRPFSFPTLRISQFAALMCQSANLFSHLLDAAEVASLRRLFDVKASDYWKSHFLFDKETPGSDKHLGKNFVDVLLINAWVPLLFAYGEDHDDEQRKEQALALLRQLPPERNRIVERWQEAGIKVESAADSQALIQRYNNYCERKECLRCPLAFRLLKY